MAFIENLDPFFSDWGETVIVDGAFPLTAIFNDDFQPLDSDYLTVSSSSPQIDVQSADVARLGIVRGTIITIQGTDYSVHDLQPDGTGISVLRLHRN